MIKRLITLSFVIISLLVHSQTTEMVLIGDSQEKAKITVKEMADIDTDFKYEEYSGWYDGINDYVTQYSIWSPDGMLFKNVFAVDGNVVLHVVLSSEPPENTTQSRLDEIKNLLRGENAPPDITYLRNDTYEVKINNEFYCYRKHLIFYANNKSKIQTYIIDASNFDALQRYTRIWTSMAKDKLQYRYL